MAAGLRALLIALLCMPPMAVAESLPDPTRPAIDLSGGSGDTMEAAQVAPPPRGLQSIIISPQYRAAIINGETVRLGARIGDSRLVEVRENSVVLQNAEGRRVLELFPRVGIRMNEAARQKSRTPERAPGEADLPEKEVGGVK